MYEYGLTQQIYIPFKKQALTCFILINIIILENQIQIPFLHLFNKDLNLLNLLKWVYKEGILLWVRQNMHFKLFRIAIWFNNNVIVVKSYIVSCNRVRFILIFSCETNICSIYFTAEWTNELIHYLTGHVISWCLQWIWQHRWIGSEILKIHLEKYSSYSSVFC